jgi:hypothetical protein
VDDDGRAEGHFRFTLEGRMIEADFHSEDLYSDEYLTGYSFRFHTRPEDIELRQNGLCTKWEDLDELVAKGAVLTSQGSSLEDAAPSFRTAFAAAKERRPELGGAIRWSLQGRRAGGLRLVLQGLPTSAVSLKRSAYHSAEDSPAICLDSARILYQQEPPHLAAGPAPVLFARDPEAAMEQLSAHPDNIREGKWTHI